ncbi:MAG TPA: GxxExxY protein [Pirellulaceae bacterium]|nr:GxxExxY protein [Pirellulaceae bacterium]
MQYEEVSAEDERIATIVVDAAMKVHRALGPGLLESVYEVCLAHELRKRGLTVRRQDPIPINYDGVRFEEGFRFDLLVEERILCEIKSVQTLHPICTAQVLTYLKFTN